MGTNRVFGRAGLAGALVDGGMACVDVGHQVLAGEVSLGGALATIGKETVMGGCAAVCAALVPAAMARVLGPLPVATVLAVSAESHKVGKYLLRAAASHVCERWR